jgi:hypothetical protein
MRSPQLMPRSIGVSRCIVVSSSVRRCRCCLTSLAPQVIKTRATGKQALHAVLILDVISAQLQQLQAAESRAEALQADRQLIQVEQHCTQDASSNKSAPRVHFADGEGACDSPVLARQANESGGENDGTPGSSPEKHTIE